MKTTYLRRAGALLLAALTLTALGVVKAVAADSPDKLPAPQVAIHIELIRATAGDVAKAGIAFDYTPFAPAVTGSFPSDLSARAGNDEGSLATAHGTSAAQLLKYLETHGKILSKPVIQTVDQVPAAISFTEPIQGPIGGGVGGYLVYSNSLITRINITPNVETDGSISYTLSLYLLGGQKQPHMTLISQETIKTEQKVKSGEISALGGLATDSTAAAGVPLLTDGLAKDGGFGAADPKMPVLFMFVTAVAGWVPEVEGIHAIVSN